MRGPGSWETRHWGASALVLAIVFVAMLLFIYRQVNPSTGSGAPPATTTTSSVAAIEVPPSRSVETEPLSTTTLSRVTTTLPRTTTTRPRTTTTEADTATTEPESTTTSPPIVTIP